MSTSPRSSRPWTTIGAGAAAVAACAACCAGPLLALLGGVGAASALAALWIPALAILAVAALAGMVWALRRRATACTTEPGSVDLGMPTVSDRPGSWDDVTAR
jgi:hypothetical protein